MVLLVGLLGFQLRSVIVGVPPVLPEVRDELHLSFAATGALSATPVLCLGLAAVPGAVLANRLGARLVVGLGTVGLGLAALLRLAPPQPVALFLFSASMALCVAVVQPAILVYIRHWFPDDVQRVSAVYTTALGLGGLAGASLSVPLLALGGWRGTFVVWAVPALAVGLLWLAWAPGRGDEHAPQPSGLLPLVRESAVWQVAALFGSQSLVYYGATTWIPFELRSQGPGYLSLVLLVFNLTGLPVGLVLAATSWPWATSRRFYAGAGLLLLLGTGGFAVGATDLAWLWACLLGVAVSLLFSGATVLPALLARRPDDVAGFSALTLTAGYSISFAGPLLGGVILDHTHVLESPFWLMVAAGASALVLGLRLPQPPGETTASAAEVSLVGAARPDGSSH